MAQKKQPFDLVLTKTAVAGSNDVSMDPVAPGWLWCIQRVAVENETTAYTDLRLLKAGRAADLLLVEEDSPAAATLYWINKPVYLMEMQYLVARLSGCTVGDVIKVYLTGWKSKTVEITP